MTALGTLSPAEARKWRTYRLINIQTGETIETSTYVNWPRTVEALVMDGLARPNDEIHCDQILTDDHPLEGAEYITVNGTPVAFTSWDLHPTSADEMRAALFPKQQIAEAAE